MTLYVIYFWNTKKKKLSFTWLSRRMCSDLKADKWQNRHVCVLFEVCVRMWKYMNKKKDQDIRNANRSSKCKNTWRIKNIFMTKINIMWHPNKTHGEQKACNEKICQICVTNVKHIHRWNYVRTLWWKNVFQMAGHNRGVLRACEIDKSTCQTKIGATSWNTGHVVWKVGPV